MAKVYDIVTSDNGELIIAHGDFLIEESTRYHQRDILLANVGEYKQHPTVGVGLPDFINDQNQDDMIREIRKQMLADNMKNVRINIERKKLVIHGEY
ncbi:MAG: hypothetical protein SNJ71_00170 [Bacteroidales bacterium]